MARLRVVYQPTTMTPRLDADGAAVTPSLYPPSANPCPDCPARCCTSRVETSIADVVRFLHGLSLPFAAAFELAEGGQRPIELDVGPRVFVLRRNADGYCRFLGRYDDELRCGVYELRPATCRLYPFTFASEAQRIGPRTIRCPVSFGIGHARERSLRAAAAQALEDWAAHAELARAWRRKRKDRSLPAFLRFALERMGEDPSRSPALWPVGSSARGFEMLRRHKVLR